MSFLTDWASTDRVLLVGDVRQHQAVEAGRPYQQLQEAGMQTARLDEIVRQQDPALREAVEQLARGEVKEAIHNLDGQGRVHEIVDRHDRLREMAREYAARPEGTLIVSPDNDSRREINTLTHRELQERGVVGTEEHAVKVLQARQELTGADRAWAGQYDEGDVVRYAKGSARLGIEPGEYARVERVDTKQNLITIERASGQQQTYDPRRLQGVAIYRENERAISRRRAGAVHFAEQRAEGGQSRAGHHRENRRQWRVQIRMDSGREVEFNLPPASASGLRLRADQPQQPGQTADRVLIHIDTERGQQQVNSRTAYVSISRGRHDARIYTNDKTDLPYQLSRDVSHRTAIQTVQDTAQKVEPAQAQMQ